MKPGDLVAGRFQVELQANAGGMGVVYRARDRVTGEVVALKGLHPHAGPRSADTIARFQREAEVLAELRHPGIVRYIAHGVAEGGAAWLAIEWLEGMDLGVRLQGGALGLDESVALGRRLAEALGAAHARGIVHRDVKPDNLFLAGGALDRVKILDFGIARLDDGRPARTRTGVTLGTPGYMAPEQARGDREVGPRADVFALGCVLFECLTGRPVFVAEHVMAILAKVLLEEAPRVSELCPDVPEALDELVARMLAKDPAERPEGGAAAAAALAAVHDGPATSLAPSRLGRPPALGAGEKRLLSIVLADARGAVDPAPLGDALAATLTTDDAAATAELIRRELAHFGARVESLLDGSVVATLTGGGSATDQAAQAARFALAMRGLLPEIPMALATGRGWVRSARWPVGEAIDRAARLLRDERRPGAIAPPRPRPVRLDDATAGLLDVRFDVGGDAVGLTLHGEREGAQATRTLLGKATPCVGRERELAVLLGLVDECVSEPAARAVLLTGPAGSGKSRLRYELVRAVNERVPEAEIWVSRGDPMSAGAAFGMIAPALRRAAGLYDGEPLGVRRQKLRARFGRHLAPGELDRVTEFLGELVGTPFSAADSVELVAARADAMLMGDQMRRAWETLLAAECAAHPVLLVLEDLHWGDWPSVQFVDAALRRLEGLPFLVLALGRPELRELFPRLWEERAVYELRLPDLSRKAGERLVREVLGPDVDAATVARLVAQAAGNPFYLEELIRAVDGGKGEHLPETVLAMVEARLERLDPAARRVLRAGSVFGQAFWQGGVLALLGGKEAAPELDATLERIVATESIQRRVSGRFPAQVEYVFRQSIVREAAYAMLTDGDRALGHELAAGWLERAGEASAIVLAEHLERGGRPARAVPHWLRAALQELEGDDLAAAIRHAERGIACGAAGEPLGALLLLLAEARRWRNENADAARAAEQARAVLPRGSGPWFVAVSELASAHGKLGQTDALVTLAAELLHEPAFQGAPATEAPAGESGPIAALFQTVVQLLHAGRYALAGELLARIGGAEGDAPPSLPRAAGRTAPPLRNPRDIARVHQARAVWAIARGDAAGYRRETERSIEHAERAGDLRMACLQRANLGDAYTHLGGFAEAERVLGEALAGAARMRLDFVQIVAKINLGIVLASQGRVEEGLRVLREAQAAHRTQSDRRVTVGVQIYLSLAQSLAADFEEAERSARAALEGARDLPPLEAYARAILARVLLASGRADEAAPEATRAKELLDTLGEIEAGESLVRLVWAEALFAVGDRDGALAAIVAARANLLARAARITDPAWRESFLHRVPDNAATLARARRWLGE